MNFAAMGADFDFVAKGHRKPPFSMYAPKVCENAENSWRVQLGHMLFFIFLCPDWRAKTGHREVFFYMCPTRKTGHLFCAV